MEKLIKLKYKSKIPLVIPKLKNRPMGVKLPLTGANGIMLPENDQIIYVTENEAGDLIRSRPNLFSEIKQTKKKEEKENGENRV